MIRYVVASTLKPYFPRVHQPIRFKLVFEFVFTVGLKYMAPKLFEKGYIGFEEEVAAKLQPVRSCSWAGMA